MRFVIQRVNHAKCTIDGNITGSIEKGLCVLIGIAETDTKEIADKMIKKLINMTESYCSYRSLRFMQIVRKAIVLHLWRQEVLIWQTSFMNTASASVIRQFPEYKEGCLEPI